MSGGEVSGAEAAPECWDQPKLTEQEEPRQFVVAFDDSEPGKVDFDDEEVARALNEQAK